MLYDTSQTNVILIENLKKNTNDTKEKSSQNM